MRHGHGQTSNSAKERRRRARQPAVDRAKEERNRQRARGGGQPNELGVTQGQNAEQGNTIDPRNAQESGKIRH
jgi:hypothetical protein